MTEEKLTHTWSKKRIQALYGTFCRFCDDLTDDEQKRFHGTILDTKGLMLQRIQMATDGTKNNKQE